MDDIQFDALTRRLSSRRTALAGLLGGVATLLSLARAVEALAHNPVPACQKIEDATRRTACLRRARRHNRTQHSCTPKPSETFCVNRCGTTQNNCKKKVSCACPAGKTCLANFGCNRTCDLLAPACPVGCSCGAASEGDPALTRFQCFAGGFTSCVGIPLTCVTSANCPRGFFCAEVSTSCGTDRCVPNCPF